MFILQRRDRRAFFSPCHPSSLARLCCAHVNSMGWVMMMLVRCMQGGPRGVNQHLNGDELQLVQAYYLVSSHKIRLLRRGCSIIDEEGQGPWFEKHRLESIERFVTRWYSIV